MVLQFKEKKYNWGDSFYVLDENNRRKYRVQSSIMLWKKQFVICDLDKNVLVTIRNEPKSLVKKKFYIEIDGYQEVAITKEISLIPKYIFEGLDWEMHGVMLHGYELLENGRKILSISVESTGNGIRPVLEIADSARELLALAVVMTISYVMHAEEGGKSTNHL